MSHCLYSYDALISLRAQRLIARFSNYFFYSFSICRKVRVDNRANCLNIIGRGKLGWAAGKKCIVTDLPNQK